jgi:hypothetical protein
MRNGRGHGFVKTTRTALTGPAKCVVHTATETKRILYMFRRFGKSGWFNKPLRFRFAGAAPLGDINEGVASQFLI